MLAAATCLLACKDSISLRKQTLKSMKQLSTLLPLHYSYCPSPIGLIELGATAHALVTLYFVEEARHATAPVDAQNSESSAASATILAMAEQQLREYFAHTRQHFDLPLHFQGTDFQQRVWRQLLTVPYSKTASYQTIANALDNPKAVRAVGAANGQNPISIIAPCHRIIGSNGRLIGYGGGLWRKEWLLKHEGYLLL